MLKFYSHPFSPWSKKVHLLLEELKIPYEIVNVDLEKGEQRKTMSNFLGRVPAIEIKDGIRLSESGAIVRYLTEKSGRFDLYPANLEDRARVEEWMEYTTNKICRPLLELAWNLTMVYTFNQKPIEGIIAKAKKNLARDFATLENRLQGRTYLASECYTLADLSLAAFFPLLPEAKWETNSYPNTVRWWKVVKNRKALQATVR